MKLPCSTDLKDREPFHKLQRATGAGSYDGAGAPRGLAALTPCAACVVRGGLLASILFGLCLVSATGLASWAEAATAGPAARPNVVLCMADDQGWGDVGYRGGTPVKTPVLDQMAASGLCLERFYAAAPVCSPTRGSVLTGRHPNRFGCFSWGRTLRPQEITVAEALKTAGYTTGHFGKWHVGSVMADGPACPGTSGFDHWVSCPNFFDLSPLMSDRGRVIETEGDSSVVTVEQAIPFVRQAVADKRPFLAVVWFGSPHHPHQALPEDRALYKDQTEKLQNFYGELSAMDRAVGMLRAELQRLQVADNTLFWYCSDNGVLPEGSSGGLKGRKGSLWEGGIRVPAIIEWPDRIAAPRVSEVPCGTVDIYPTLLEVAGVKVAEQPPLDGTSLLPLVEGRMTRREQPLGFWVYERRGIPRRSRDILARLQAVQRGEAAADTVECPYEDLGQITKHYPEDNLPGHAAWLDGHWKLHRVPTKSGEVDYVLFDLAADPQETTDLASQQPDRVRRMKAGLDAWQRSVVGSLNGEDYRE